MTSPETTDVHDGDFSLRYTQNIHLSALVFGVLANVSNPARVNESWQWTMGLSVNRWQAFLARAYQTWLYDKKKDGRAGLCYGLFPSTVWK